MNHLRLALIATAAAGCSVPNPQPAASPTRVLPVAGTIAFYSQPYARQEPGPDLKMPRFCHVSIDCMDLDSRPFEPCYANGAPCEGEGGFMRAAPRIIIETVQPEHIGPLPGVPQKK